MTEYFEKLKNKLQLIGVILSIIFTMGSIGGLVWAADKWMDNKLAEYATNHDVNAVQMMVIENRKDFYQEKIFEIEDKVIDGLATPTDLKKKKRLEVKIQEISTEINTMRNINAP